MPYPTAVGHVCEAPGVARFVWNDVTGMGDGLLVDMEGADPRWRSVADVLLWPEPTGVTVARSHLSAGPAVLAVFLTDENTWRAMDAVSWKDRYFSVASRESWWGVLVATYRSVLVGQFCHGVSREEQSPDEVAASAATLDRRISACGSSVAAYRSLASR